MKFKITFLLLIVAFCLLICSCTNSSLSLNKVYVCEDNSLLTMDIAKGSVTYNKAERVFTPQAVKSNVKIGKQDKQIQLGDNTVNVAYEYTFGKEYCGYKVDGYSNEEYKIRAQFREDNGNLEYLALGKYEYRIYDGLIETEATLKEICTEYLSEYIEDLSPYTVEITTKAQIIDEHGLENEKISGFVFPLEYENAEIAYEVNFVYYISGIKTSDLITIRVDSNGYLEIISFNMTGAFESFGDSDVDTKLCEELISAEMQKLCDVDEYEYEGYTDKKILVIVKNKLCVLSYAQPSYNVAEETEHFLASEIVLLLPIAK